MGEPGGCIFSSYRVVQEAKTRTVHVLYLASVPSSDQITLESTVYCISRHCPAISQTKRHLNVDAEAPLISRLNEPATWTSGGCAMQPTTWSRCHSVHPGWTLDERLTLSNNDGSAPLRLRARPAKDPRIWQKSTPESCGGPPGVRDNSHTQISTRARSHPRNVSLSLSRFQHLPNHQWSPSFAP